MFPGFGCPGFGFPMNWFNTFMHFNTIDDGDPLIWMHFSTLVFLFGSERQQTFLQTKLVYPFQLIKMHPKEKRGGAIVYRAKAVQSTPKSN